MLIFFKVTLNLSPKRLFDSFVSSEVSQWLTEFTFLRSDNILDLMFSSAIDRIGDVNIHCPFFPWGYRPIVFDYTLEFSYELTKKNCLSKLGGMENLEKWIQHLKRWIGI